MPEKKATILVVFVWWLWTKKNNLWSRSPLSHRWATSPWAKRVWLPIPAQFASHSYCETPDRFSSFFEKKIASIRSETDSQPAETPELDSQPHLTQSLFCWQWTLWICASVSRVGLQTRMRFCSQKLCSRSDLDHFVKNVDDLVPLIGRIVNESLLTGSVPLQFKEAVVTPPFWRKLKTKTNWPWCKQLKNKTTDLCETCNFSTNFSRRLWCISFSTICWPTILW